MTHVENAEAFARLIAFCSGYGGKYNPGRQNLRIDALVNQLQAALVLLENIRVAKTEFDNQTNLRRQVYNQLPQLIASIMRLLEAADAKPEKLKDARAYVHSIIGRAPRNRKPVSSETIGNIAQHRSHRQLAYVSKADSFSRLVKSVNTEPLYQFREKQLSRSGLEEKVDELNQLNQRVAEAQTKWRNSIVERNAVFYSSEASLMESARSVKKYVRAIYGLKSAQYALVKNVRFAKPNIR